MPPEGLNYEEIKAFLKFLAMNSISKESSRLASFRRSPFISLYLGETHFGSENTVLFTSQRSVCVAARDLTLLLVVFSLSYIAHANSVSIILKWDHGNVLFSPQYSVWISNFRVLYFCLSICSLISWSWAISCLLVKWKASVRVRSPINTYHPSGNRDFSW